MRNIKLTIEYDGTHYAGWQSQANATAVQDVVTQAIQTMVEEPIILRGASRTDAGVHALKQIACFETTKNIPCKGFLKGLNTLLPTDIRIIQCEEVLQSFHSIKDAKQKHYQYLLELGEGPSALWRNRAWWVGPKLDIETMEKAGRYLIGEHDFKSFQGPLSDTKTTVRKITELSLRTQQNNLQRSHNDTVSLYFTGNGFLKYMIRNMVGTLVEIGLGKRSVESMKTILEAKDRRQAGPTAPAQGLYLLGIDY